MTDTTDARAKEKKKIDSSRRCVSCNHACSMSGMCMKQWPEFTVRAKQDATGGAPDGTGD